MYYHVQKSACMQNSATVGRTDTMDYRPFYKSTALKVEGSLHTWTPTLPESEGVRTPGPPQTPPLGSRQSYCNNNQVYFFLAHPVDILNNSTNAECDIIIICRHLLLTR